DRPRQAGRSLLGGSIERLLPGERLAAVKNLARREGATLFMTLLAAFYATLHRTSGQRDLVLGTDLAHRNHRALEGLIGFFVDHPVLRVKVEPGKPARELLQAVKRTTLEAYARQDVPFEHLVEQLEPERLPGVTPLFQVLFVLQEPLAEEIHLGSCRLEPLAVDGGRVKFDLVAMAQEEPAGLRLTLRYARSLFDASTLERLARDFDAVLAELCANPDRPLEQFSLPSQAEGDPSAMEAPPSPSSPTGPRAKRRRAVALDAVEPVRTRTVTGGATRAFVFEPESPDVDLPGWVASARAEIDARLAEAGALLFRGFPLASVKDFERVATALCPSLYDGYGDLPRADLGDRIYQSTPYPEDLRILFHNESSHLDSWPWHQMFFCVQPSATGGETPITDCREVYRQMDPALCQRFEEQGLLYVRNFIAGVEPSWQSFFKTDDRDRVAEICRESRLEIEWQGEDGLRTKKRSPAVIRHPVSGEKLFFNQIQAHHVSCLDPATRESLEQMVSEAELPRNVYFGDGSPIPDATVMELIDLYDRLSLVFPWQKGDLVVVDNMLIAHARNSFTGPRKITVAMGDMVSLAQLDPGRGA
nr:TauD/TfdA family dioxygenase [Thermoanaerobaculia bacterium]